LPVLKNAVKRIPEGYVYIGKALRRQEYCGNRYAIPGLACVLFVGLGGPNLRGPDNQVQKNSHWG
jgi:hypothetical protein